MHSVSNAVVVCFARTAEGLLGAQADGDFWLAVPIQGGIRVARSRRLSKPIAECAAVDFHSSEGIVTDEAAFRAHVEKVVEHRCQCVALDRQHIELAPFTPWGAADTSVRYADGIVCHSTPSHGGFHVDEARSADMPKALRNADGWYEEDEQWAKVATAFPGLFTDYEREVAEKTLRDWEPDAWEAIYGRKLDPSESFTRDRQRFEREHANHWVVISASRSDVHPGQVECIATVGGKRGTVPQRAFLVPRNEYRIGRHGFVIDELRHPEI